ncbi:putative carboxylesterase [Patellaria atrata CBS 101060]|uniref:Carboxylic ester hydrolase n=1 Tax=Patellaria atrata CBS 101060 TaxID=1346257 RepID=A0A9P4VLV0_9PEZI|nr:putative carboxylesterase [Patellaria atrata CBS 101060]
MAGRTVVSFLVLVIAALLVPTLTANPLVDSRPFLSNSETSLTLLYQNNFNLSDSASHVSAILLDPLPQSQAASACAALSETLISESTIRAHRADFLRQFSYLAYSGRSSSVQSYHINGGVVVTTGNFNNLAFKPNIARFSRLPVLCTQSTQVAFANATASASNQISVASQGNTFVGFRNKKSFRFQGIPYADTPKRWQYSALYSPRGQTIQATSYGPQCAQGGGGSEDCLSLNIQTPYIPKSGSRKNLKPVLFWIHGGGFTGGTGADPLSDGGDLASREDIVVVTINYRLSTLGFLAIPGTSIKGNYGIQDQITALEWTIKNIAQFGGDPKKITISGESAGAGSVRTLLGSPKAIGKFQGAIAMSSLGGGVTLGLSGDYGTTYSTYYSIPQSYAVAGQNIFQAAGCTQNTLDEQISCLETVPALDLIRLSSVARYVVQDGTYVNTAQLIVSKKNASTAHIPVIFGVARDDGASFSTYPKTPVTTEVEGIQAALGISASYAQSIIDSGLFPYYDTGNVTFDSFNVSQRVATDKTFRCIDQATVYAGSKSGAFQSAYYYQMERSYGGYDPNNLGGPPITPGYPNGNPNLPYFRLHGSDMPWLFGTLSTLRDANDLYSIQLTAGYFAEYVRSRQPNPKQSYLRARGYTTTLNAIERTGPWLPVKGAEGPIKLFDYPSYSSSFIDVPQCAFLNYSVSYYLEGGR